MKVETFWRSPGDKDFKDEQRQLLDFARLPAVGEYVHMEARDSAWVRVDAVLHFAYEGPAIARIYCTAYDEIDILHEILELED